MTGSPSIKEAVLAWIRENGSGPSEAARKFDLPVERVKKWVSRDRQKRENGDGDKGQAIVPGRVPSRGKPSLADVRAADRSRILGFKDRVLGHLDSEDVLKDTRKARDLVGALVQLSGALTDLLTLDERTLIADMAGHGPGGSEAEASDIAEAFAESGIPVEEG